MAQGDIRDTVPKFKAEKATRLFWSDMNTMKPSSKNRRRPYQWPDNGCTCIQSAATSEGADNEDENEPVNQNSRNW